MLFALFFIFFFIIYSIISITEPLPRGTSKLFNFFFPPTVCAFALLVDVSISVGSAQISILQLNFLLDLISSSRFVDWIPVEKSIVFDLYSVCFNYTTCL